MKLIVGLGNPGKEYIKSRHNIGFLCIDKLAKKINLTLNKHTTKYRIGIGKIDSVDVCLAKPVTYMNNSGEAVRILINKFNLQLLDLLVIHDDMDIPLGKIKIKYGGSSAGHKGLQSIISSVRNNEFIRIRVGIGHPAGDMDTIEYVLADFEENELSSKDSSVVLAVEAVEYILKSGFASVMNKYNV